MRVIDVEVSRLKPHPLSELVFGRLPDDQMRDLAEDIARRGLQYPIEIDPDHRVLCGSQRLLAVRELGWKVVPAIHRRFDCEADLEEHLLRDNLHRRHLSPGQVYRAAKELERIEAARAASRTGGRGSKAGEGSAARLAARAAGTSATTFERLKLVYEHGDEDLQRQVDQGRISVAAAAAKVSPSKMRARRLPGDDARAHALRMARLKREGNRLARYLELHDLDEYGAHTQDATTFALDLSAKLVSWSERQVDAKGSYATHTAATG